MSRDFLRGHAGPGFVDLHEEAAVDVGRDADAGGVEPAAIGGAVDGGCAQMKDIGPCGDPTAAISMCVCLRSLLDFGPIAGKGRPYQNLSMANLESDWTPSESSPESAAPLRIIR